MVNQDLLLHNGGAAPDDSQDAALRHPPVQDGYRMPAEWQPHDRCWMGWPRRPDNWRNNAGPAMEAYSRVVTAIMEFEPVTVCAPDISQVRKAGASADSEGTVPAETEVVHMDQNDSWFRDTGPAFLVRENPGQAGGQELAGVDWIFNAWGGETGGLYKNWDLDDKIAAQILQRAGAARYRCRAVMEGGSFHVDGEGTVMTTEECLLNANRNPMLSKAQIEQILKGYLGIQKVLWLPKGLYADDDTNGHVDNFACFVRPGVVLLAWTDDTTDPQHAVSGEALRYLEGETDAKGRRLEVLKMPCPPPLHITEEEAAGVAKIDGSKPRQAGDRLAGSYVNFYLPNGGVIAPQFGNEAAAADARALQIFQEIYPGRKVVGVQTREILLGGGNIHCITQQQPSLNAKTS